MEQSSAANGPQRILCRHDVSVYWKLAASPNDFLQAKFSREHEWRFDGGLVVPASPSPHVVPAPWSHESHVDPEEAFVAAISSCHMLTFLYLASRDGAIVTEYQDQASGEMTRNGEGIPWVSRVHLHPQITWSESSQVSQTQLEDLHHQAHRQCFIANSVRSDIVIHTLPDGGQ